MLACRLISRKTEPLDKMITRVQTARQEMCHLPEFDYGACRTAHSWACRPTGMSSASSASVPDMQWLQHHPNG